MRKTICKLSNVIELNTTAIIYKYCYDNNVEKKTADKVYRVMCLLGFDDSAMVEEEKILEYLDKITPPLSGGGKRWSEYLFGVIDGVFSANVTVTSNTVNILGKNKFGNAITRTYNV